MPVGPRLWKIASFRLVAGERANIIANGILAALIFIGDTVTPRGVSVNALYAIVIALAALSPPVRAPFIWAAICTILSAISSALGPSALPLEWDVLDRVMTTSVLWLVAVVSFRIRSETARAKAAEDAKRRFIATASHDIRQPVQSINLFASVLSETVNDRQARQAIDGLTESVQALDSLLEKILDFSKLEVGQVKVNTTAFPLGQLMKRLGSEYTPRATEKGLRLTIVPTKLWICSDPVLVERLLRNLIENAIRYTSTGGIVVGCRRLPSQLRLDVIDTGAGIPADQISTIFQEFTQIEEPGRQEGHGLGLSIVSRTAKLLGHQVQVASIEGRGSRFSVVMPIATGQQQAEMDAGRGEG